VPITRTRRLLLAAAVVVLSLIAPLSANAFGPSVLYAPNARDCTRPSCVTYVKSAQLPSGKLVASFEDNSQPAVGQKWPVWTSLDEGRTWTKTGTIPDTNRGWGNWTNPFLYVLPQQIGTMPAGTLLMAGISAPPDRSATAIELYKSNDEGQTWTWVSEIAVGGSETTQPVWEPYLLVANGKLIAYYSDERDDTNHDQKLVHQVSTNGVTWGPVVEDVALADRNLRPGMPIVTKMANGQYLMTFEIVGAPGLPNHYKISNDPEAWNPSDDGTLIDFGGSPNVITLPNGRLVYNSYGSTDVRVNTNNGLGPWTPMKTTMPVGYSRHLQYLRGSGRVLILSVDGFWTSSTNTVYVGDADLGFSAGPYYKLVNRKSGKVLDVSQANLQDGADVIQWTDTGSANQLWHVSDAGGGYKNLLSKNSGRALSIWARGTVNGDRAVQWVENDGNDQDWQLVPSGSYYKIQNRNSGRLLSVLGGSIADGAQVVQWQDTGTLDQQWSLVQVSP
jgi:hypothetical protein